LNDFDRLASVYDLDMGTKIDDIPMYIRHAEILGGPILELGSGTGRVILHLAKQGFDVWGLDNSVGMTSIARQRVAELQDQLPGQVRFVDGDMRTDVIDEIGFKLIFIAYNTFLHLIERDDQLTTLRNMYQMLSDDGRIIIDIFTPRHRDLSQYDYHRQELPIYRGVYQDELSGITYVRNDRIQLDLANQLQVVEFIYDKIGSDGSIDRESHSVESRYIFRPEMELLLELSGFDIIELRGGYQKDSAYDYHNSEVMVFIATKKK